MEKVEVIKLAVNNLYEQNPNLDFVVERDDTKTQYEVIPVIMIGELNGDQQKGVPLENLWKVYDIPEEFDSLIKPYFFDTISEAAQNDIYIEFVVYRHPPKGRGSIAPVLLQKATKHDIELTMKQKYLIGEAGV